tara:strand:+ start:21646 stop:21894 length:249 start_codon:yes stop_codon:yes gene_type:complete
MQLHCEITNAERRAVVRHLTTNHKLAGKYLEKLLSKYEIRTSNLQREITSLKMELDDREIAIRLFFDGKLTEQQLKELIDYE